MTCIVGLVGPDGAVTIMGDSGASIPGTIWVRKDRKVWKTGELAFGIAGSYRGRDLLMYHPVQQPGRNVDLDLYMRTTFVDSVRETFKAGGFLTSFKEGDDSSKSVLLIGVRGRLFEMDRDFQIGEVETEYHAIGSGAAEARGSLFSTRDWTDPIKRLNEALRASTYFNSGTVQPPFFYVQTDPVSVQKAA